MPNHTQLILRRNIFFSSTDVSSYTKNQLHTPTHPWDTVDLSFWSTLGIWACPAMLDHTHLIFMNQFTASIDACPHTQNQINLYSSSWDIRSITWKYFGHTVPVQTILIWYLWIRLLLLLMFIYIQNNLLYTWIHSWDTAPSRILQYNWSKLFWVITKKQEFCQIWDLQYEVKSYKNFHFKLFLGKSDDNIFKNYRIPHFWVFSPKMNVLQKSGPVSF